MWLQYARSARLFPLGARLSPQKAGTLRNEMSGYGLRVPCFGNVEEL